MTDSTERYPANSAGIAEASARVERFLAEQGLGEREAKRLCLTVETLLRRIGERLGRATPCDLTLERRMGRACIRIRYSGEEFDPTVTGRADEGNIWSERLLAELGLVPEWSRRRGINCLTLWARRRERSVWLTHFGALLLAALLCLVLPAPWLDAAERWALKPLRELLCRVWGALGGALVFFSAAAVVCGVGDTLLLGRKARRMLTRFVGITLLWTAIGAAAFAVLLPPEGAARDAWGERFWAALTALVPSDPVSPFVSGNVPQLLFLALVSGTALTLPGGRTGRLRAWAEQCALWLRALAEGVCRLTPLLLFCAAPLLRGVGAPRMLWQPLALFALLALAAVAIKLLIVSAGRREDPARLRKALFPAIRTAFRSGSADAAFGMALDACENDLRIPHEQLLLGLPVGNTLCIPIAALCMPAAILCLARGGMLTVDTLQLAALSLLGVLLAMVLPRVPGARLFGFWLLLRPAALPPEGLALSAVLCLFFDAAAAALSAVYLPLEMRRQSDLADTEDER